MPRKRRSFTPEFKEEAAKMVVESSRSAAQVARELQIDEQTLRNWVNDYRDAHVEDEPPLTVSERARLRELEKEFRELRLEKEFLGKAVLDSTGRCNRANRGGVCGAGGSAGDVGCDEGGVVETVEGR